MVRSELEDSPVSVDDYARNARITERFWYSRYTKIWLVLIIAEWIALEFVAYAQPDLKYAVLEKVLRFLFVPLNPLSLMLVRGLDLLRAKRARLRTVDRYH